MVAGLSVQVASLLLFGFMCLEFAWRVHKHHFQLNQKHAELYNSRRFKIFLCCRLLFPFFLVLAKERKKHWHLQQSQSSPVPSSESLSFQVGSAATWRMTRSRT